ncbi:DNA primase large subunit [Marchantia polymorpha subsp. ruderalis]|uniref:DNA primase large subunit n=2 Tax=Marchantia polymorpha TaxID=3197 RepID=A0AAF6C0S5_MARPO|nr:hypothetical protein MARPO_0051s0085 [Marchantia polymorpha]BBN17859.1 hypothetical protein Mp_7g17480 [Marchantia polymorpha subsp. ruderalis]|eukprot:PTQ38484.1 hypothetical protein MARPO_0051s0085 [Marchantia polymorpha]
MEFKVAGGRRTSFGDASDVGGVQSRLSFYSNSSDVDVSLEDFEQFAMDRLRVLKGIEEGRTRGRKAEEIDALVVDLWRKHMRTPNAADIATKDMVSHFVLRLAYCRTEELRRWFLAMESALFRARFRAESPESQRKFMEDQKLPYKAISSTEFESVKEKLGQVARSLNQPVPTADNTFYKVPFEEVPELVSARRVYLQRGFAFVPRDQLASIVVGQFRARLSKALALTNRLWTSTIAVEEKDRLTPIVEALSMRYLGADYSQPSKGFVGLQDLDNLAKNSFPLCMRHLFFNLRHEHHLKFGGRQQLGLFLKGIGLKLEDALNFWRSEFTVKMTTEKFDKEYGYSIRHNFGKEGKRVDYTPYSCMKIITSTPGVGDHHGCPYRHFSQENLRSVLEDQQLSSRTVDAVMEKVRNRHYQLACATTFEAIHGCPSDGINHPNQYFEQSRRALQGGGQAENTSSSNGLQSVPLPAHHDPPHPVERGTLPIPGP